MDRQLKYRNSQAVKVERLPADAQRSLTVNDTTRRTESFIWINSNRSFLFAFVQEALKSLFAEASCEISSLPTLVADFAPSFVTPGMPSDFVSGTNDITNRRGIDVEVPRFGEIGGRDDFLSGRLLARGFCQDLQLRPCCRL
jgi:hypothetical protein